jgi:isoquinoline 1-oxidoreductase beta subunit
VPVEGGSAIACRRKANSPASLRRGASALPVPKDPPLKDPAAYTLVGSRVRRYDGHAIVAGGAVYGLDVKVPGMKRAAVTRSHRSTGAGRNGECAGRTGDSRRPDVIEIPTGIAVTADDT